MNGLEQHLADNKLNEVSTMNDLSDSGIISDNCVLARDVADGDCERAMKWLKLDGILI